MDNWQILAVGLCIAWAISIVVRRALALRGSSEKSGCGSGCGSCSSNNPNALSSGPAKSSAPDAGFVPLDALHTIDR
ncbi:MAG: hypothetical protein WD065_02520 [Planctomycetaceae bacterium]